MKDTRTATAWTEVGRLGEEMDGSPFASGEWVCGQTAAIRRVALHARRAAAADCTILVSGETGTGKEIWAKSIHELGPRANKPFIPVNCAALTATLAESQLFGHEKGAFTGAAGAAMGVFRAAQGGVVFLDEVGEMPLELQPKLLRVLQQMEVTSVGSARPVSIDVQVIAATNRSLSDEVENGSFREDLYFRLNMCEINVPSLRQRVADIPDFIEFFARRFAEKYQRPVWVPSADMLRQFCEYPWPGNIRQLSHVIEQAYVLDCAPSLPGVTPAARQAASGLPTFDLTKLRNMAVREALKATRNHKGRAAKLLGVHANTLTRLLAVIESESDAELAGR